MFRNTEVFLAIITPKMLFKFRPFKFVSLILWTSHFKDMRRRAIDMSSFYFRSIPTELKKSLVIGSSFQIRLPLKV